ncbi:hypothetical protein NPIL_52371 [Nephila pilipes]|uniref:Uncharacterized protein n=1 Tax=Nephila pilipes TaxID=299642 RepID=A0A8X6U0E5_NEPPI|nr:hypothetical protein NPIL_52371 [Nephila pilipes]
MYRSYFNRQMDMRTHYGHCRIPMADANHERQDIFFTQSHISQTDIIIERICIFWLRHNNKTSCFLSRPRHCMITDEFYGWLIRRRQIHYHVSHVTTLLPQLAPNVPRHCITTVIGRPQTRCFSDKRCKTEADMAMVSQY